MAAHGLVGHQGSDLSQPSARVRDAGYRYRQIGEIVVGGATTLDEAMEAWLGSEGHCRAIMNPNFEEAGAAVAGGRYWTVDFGTPEPD
jgi:uncharacterized protein YkwD